VLLRADRPIWDRRSQKAVHRACPERGSSNEPTPKASLSEDLGNEGAWGFSYVVEPDELHAMASVHLSLMIGNPLQSENPDAANTAVASDSPLVTIGTH
jgi:hypothetical protein